MTRRGTTSRGRAILVLGAACWLVAALAGSHALYPLGIGLVAVTLLALAWVRLALRRPRLTRRRPPHALVEGEDLRIELVLEPGSRFPLPTAVATDRAGALGERTVDLAPASDGRYSGSYALEDVPRGRHRLGPLGLSVSDPFGLAHAETTIPQQDALLVYPRLVDVGRLFFEGGGGATDGRRLLLRRPAGFELHSVREHQHGESLRRVHWASTARRGELMVKELEDSPRDELAVLLDGSESADAGTSPDSAFDAAVRVAGSIVLAQVRRGRRCALVLNTRFRETQTVASEGPEWQRALDLLAGAQPDARMSAAALLASEAGAAVRARQLVVVTSQLAPALVERLVARVLSRRPAAVVYVDAPTYAGREAGREPALLRLATAGVSVAVVHRGDDLADVLAAQPAQEAARA